MQIHKARECTLLKQDHKNNTTKTTKTQKSGQQKLNNENDISLSTYN
jgi:hypothetical protein